MPPGSIAYLFKPIQSFSRLGVHVCNESSPSISATIEPQSPRMHWWACSSPLVWRPSIHGSSDHLVSDPEVSTRVNLPPSHSCFACFRDAKIRSARTTASAKELARVTGASW
eukprot:scaffold241_cov340-Pavlova_lutheri.AAC.27